MFTLLEEKHVPLLIFSAGLGGIGIRDKSIDSLSLVSRRWSWLHVDTIVETLKQHSTIRSNTRVISNSMIFDDSGVACGFTEPVIHSYSKGKSPDQFVDVQDWIEVHFMVRIPFLFIFQCLEIPGPA